MPVVSSPRKTPARKATSSSTARRSSSTGPRDDQAAAFIAKTAPAELRKTVMIRIPPDILQRVDQAARRRGVSRTAFITMSLTEKLEQMENTPAHATQR